MLLQTKNLFFLNRQWEIAEKLFIFKLESASDPKP